MILAISGPDGVGKSSIVTGLHGCPEFKSDIKWQRFNKCTVIPFNALMRLSGRNYYESYDWGGLGYHEYSGNIGRFYICLLYFDFLIFKLIHRIQWRKYYPNSNGENLILDRYLVDVICDAIVATDNARMVLTIFSKFVHELESTHRFLIVTCDYDEVLRRRPDIADDKVYLRKIRAYKLVSKFYRIAGIDTSKIDLNEAVMRAKSHLEL